LNNEASGHRTKVVHKMCTGIENVPIKCDGRQTRSGSSFRHPRGTLAMDRIEQCFVVLAMTGFWVLLAGVAMLSV